MKRILLVVAMVAVVAIGATGCEPAMTISAHPRTQADGGPPARCGEGMQILGTVTPADATSRVVLQQTVGGKWQDLVGWDGPGQGRAYLLTAPVSGGGFQIQVLIWTYNVKHFRLRSEGGHAVSPGFYVSVAGGTSGLCPGY